MKIRLKILITSGIIFYGFYGNPLTIGADSLVSVESTANFPATDVDPNQVLQFAFMQNGFNLQDRTTSCTFDSVFPVAGNVNLRGGTLFLSTDLIFQNPAQLVSPGYFWGNNHQIDFSQSVTWLAATTQSTFRDTSIFLNNDFTITGSVKFLGTCLIDGRHNNINLHAGASLVVGHDAVLTLRNVDIDGLANNKIRCLDDSAHIVLDNVRCDQSGDYTFTQGSIAFSNRVIFSGGHKFNYAPTITSTINTASTLHFDIGTTFSYDPAVSKRTLLYMNDTTSFLFLNGCSLFSTRTGLSLSQGSLIIDNNVTFSSQAQYRAEGITLSSSLNTLLLGSAQLDLYGLIVLQ